MKTSLRRAGLVSCLPVLLTVVAFASALLTAREAPAATGDADVELRYAWQPNTPYQYEVSIEADFPDRKLTYKGMSMYQLRATTNGQFTLIHRGNVQPQEVMKAQGRPAGGPRGAAGARHHISHIPHHFSPPSMGGPPKEHEVTMDARGHIIKLSGETQLPMLLGDLALLVVEPLPATADSKWEVVRGLTVIERQKEQTTPLGHRLHRPGAEEPSQTLRPGAERMTYEIKSVADGLATITRTTYLRTAEEAEGPKLREQTSTGELVFDTKRGVLTKADVKLVNVISSDNITVKVPATFHYALLDDAELARRADEGKARIEEMKANRVKADQAAAQPLTDDEARELIAGLKEKRTVRDAARKLSKRTNTDAHRAEVARALESLLNDPDNGVKSSAAEALKVWGAADNVPALVKVLSDSDDHFVCARAIDALGAINDPRGAEAIAGKFFKLRGEARKALEQMGTAAEPAVIPLLDDREESVRGDACRVLAVIGTSQSRAKLEKLALKSRGFDASAAREALEKIASRTN